MIRGRGIHNIGRGGSRIKESMSACDHNCDKGAMSACDHNHNMGEKGGGLT